MISVIELTAEYNTTKIVYDYLTKGHYHAHLSQEQDSFGVMFVYEDFESEIEKTFDDILVSDYLEHPKSYAAKLNDQIVGYIVINHEKYNNRIRVTQFLVLNGYRNMGIGKLLMKHAEDYARSVNARAMILETQSCNISAINFYFRCGFQF
ncbi:MAG: GNAT family N-acetyltransferase, partial [Erysipelotrichaceae bacterium]|nr:GNAT family N-acetyltransferase [Erysipelotrichaceae bacterium]